MIVVEKTVVMIAGVCCQTSLNGENIKRTGGARGSGSSGFWLTEFSPNTHFYHSQPSTHSMTLILNTTVHSFITRYPPQPIPSPSITLYPNIFPSILTPQTAKSIHMLPRPPTLTPTASLSLLYTLITAVYNPPTS